MGAFTTTAMLVILALTFSPYECSVCEKVTRLCTRTLLAMSQDIGPLNKNVDEDCSLVDRFKDCIGDCGTNVEHDPAERAVAAVLKYMCDPVRRDEVRQVASAECFQDHSGFKASLHQKAHNCAYTTVKDMAATATGPVQNYIRPLVKNMMACFKDGLGETCGESVVTLFNGMTGAVKREFLS